MLPLPIALYPFPAIPIEVKERILFFCLYGGGEFSPYLQNDDLTALPSDGLEQQSAFANAFLTVDKHTSGIAARLLARSILVTSAEDLRRHCVSAATHFAPDLHSTYGSLCRRLEIRTTNDLDSSVLTPLLPLLPQIQVLVVRTHWMRSGDLPVSSRLDEFVRSILTYNTSILRLQFDSGAEYLTPGICRTILTGMPLLSTLFVNRLYEDAIDDVVEPLPGPHAALGTLSVGSGPIEQTHDTRYRVPGDLFSLFPTPSFLPNLVALHLQGTLPNTRHFLSIFGSQIRELGLCSTDADFVSGHYGEQHLVAMCPSLLEVVIMSPQGMSPNLIDNIPASESIQHVSLVFIPRLRVGMWGGFTVIRHALRSSGIIAQSSLRFLEIITTPSTSAMIGQSYWFSDKREDLLHCGVQVLGVSTYTLEDQIRAILVLSGHLAALQAFDDQETTTLSLKTSRYWW